MKSCAPPFFYKLCGVNLDMIGFRVTPNGICVGNRIIN